MSDAEGTLTVDDLEEQIRAARALTTLRLIQASHDRMFGEGAFQRDKEALAPATASESDLAEGGSVVTRVNPPSP